MISVSFEVSWADVTAAKSSASAKRSIWAIKEIVCYELNLELLRRIFIAPRDQLSMIASDTAIYPEP
jgi:hypothetical protein